MHFSSQMGGSYHGVFTSYNCNQQSRTIRIYTRSVYQSSFFFIIIIIIILNITLFAYQNAITTNFTFMKHCRVGFFFRNFINGIYYYYILWGDVLYVRN